MIRNDYRRALIMLRGLNNGYSGHVRLERRTLNGSMQFTVNGTLADEPMNGVLIGESRGSWFAHNLGTLTRNRRDQAAMLVSFDPRNIQGRDLDEYQIVGVAHASNQENPLLMSGFLSGSHDTDWWSAQNAVINMMSGQAPAASGAAKAVSAQPAPMKVPASPIAQLIPVASPAATQAASEPAPVQAPSEPAPAEIEPSAIAQVEQRVAEQPTTEPPVAEQPAPMQSVGFTVPLSKDAEPPLHATALSSLPNPEQPWPPNMAALRPLFELNPPFSPFPSRDYVFVRAPMPTETGESHCAIGIKPVDNQMRVLCYAVPGTFALEPPPGLEGYAWRGTETAGYWTTCIDLQTGEPYDGDDP